MIEKLLLIRFSSIGDIIFSTAVIEGIKRAAPACELHFLSLTDYAPLLRGHPSIDRLILVDRPAGLDRLAQLAERLEGEGYSRTIDLHDSLRSQILRHYMRSARWEVYRKPRLDRFLLFAMKWNRFPDDFELTEEYLDLLGLESGALPRLFVSSEEKRRGLSLLQRFGVSRPFVACVPGAAWRNKVWTRQGYRELFEMLERRDDGRAVVLGSAGDEICDEISHGLDTIVNLRGQTDLRMSLILLSLADVAIGADTGLIHAAEALGTPAVMITGPTSRETGANVRHPRSQQVFADVWCRPCSKNGARRCIRSEQFCLTGVSSEHVFSAVESVLAEA